MSSLAQSRRIGATDDPVIVKMRGLLQTAPPGTVSLAQGVVCWQPPRAAITRATDAMVSGHADFYGPSQGLAELRSALSQSLRSDYGLTTPEVMVTAGANQAYVNVVLSVLDQGDAAVLFAPYYFNHKMALQMCGHADQLLVGPSVGHDMLPDLDWLEQELSTRNHSRGCGASSELGEIGLGAARPAAPIRLVTLCTPCNPTGVNLSRGLVERARALCEEYSAYLFLDHAYADFVHDGQGLASAEGDHVLACFSFSKAYGMAGFRVGVLAYPPALHAQLLKVQDTAVICPTIVSQHAALGALSEGGAAFVHKQVEGLRETRALILDALAPLGEGNIVGGSGAIYLLARLPAAHTDDVRVAEWLVREHRVAVIPATYCGAPGYIRVCYSNLPPAQCREAAGRLREAMEHLVATDAAVAAHG